MLCEDKITIDLVNKHLKNNNLYVEEPPWDIRPSSLGDRGLFANRNIKPGEIIFKDYPLILGPRAAKTSPPICVACYDNKDLIACSQGCGLPVCSKKCGKSINHRKECEIIGRWKGSYKFTEWKIEMLKSLTPIRSLFLNDFQKQLLLALKSHGGPQHGFEVDALKAMIVFEISEEEEKTMRFACSVLDANAFEVIVGNEANQSSLRGLYPLSSMMNHQCVPNTMHLFNDKKQMIVKATTFIPKGVEIYHSYAKLMWGTSVRQHHLLRTKHFLCTCPRCSDPSEFGTYLSAINCPKCKGYVLPTQPLNLKTTWKCVNCKELMPDHKLGIVITSLGGILGNYTQGEVEEILNFVKEKLTKFNLERNQIAMELKTRCVWTIGHKDGYLLPEVSDELLSEKETICRELLKNLQVLGAGQNKLRGLLLYELFCCLRERQKRYWLKEGRTIDSNETLEHEKLLNESIDILMDDVHAPNEVREKYLKRTTKDG